MVDKNAFLADLQTKIRRGEITPDVARANAQRVFGRNLPLDITNGITKAYKEREMVRVAERVGGKKRFRR